MKINSLKFKIPFFVTIFAFACVLVTGIILQYSFTDRLEKNIEEKNMMISQMASNELELYLNNAIETVVTAASFSTQSNNDLLEIEKEIFRMYDNFSYFDLIFFMNSDAKMVFSKPSNNNVQDRVYTDRNYYSKVIMDKKAYSLSTLLVSSVLNKLHFIVAAPVKNEEDELIGLIGAGIPLKNIENILNDFEEGFNGRIWIADETGSIAIHSEALVSDKIIKISELGIKKIKNQASIEDLVRAKTSQNIRYRIGENEFYGAVTFVEDANWLVVVEQNSKTIGNEIKEAVNNLIFIQLVVLLIALLIGLIIANWLTHPIQQLVNQVRLLPRDLKNNEVLNIGPLESQSDEISELSEAFILMTKQLKSNIDDLGNSYKRENRIQQYLNNILASVYSGIIVADANNIITIVNEQAKNITRINKAKEIPTNIFDLLDVLDLKIHDEMNQVIHNETNYSDFEATLKPIDKDTITISYTCSKVKNKNKENLGIVLQFRDITRIKEIEIELRKEDRIHTMGELSASIIHDIGNPLAGMSNLIEAVLDESIAEESKLKALNILSEEVNDLNVLVINFLDFVKSGEVKKAPTSLIKILEDCIALFSRDIVQKKILLQTIWDDGDVIVNIKGRSVKQAIINIYKNAIEAVGVFGNITMSIKENVTTVELIIQDDGNGINEEDKIKLFDPFFTTKTNGTGLGLGIAYRALRENDARLLLESELNVGSKFTIIFERI